MIYFYEILSWALHRKRDLQKIDFIICEAYFLLADKHMKKSKVQQARTT